MAIKALLLDREKEIFPLLGDIFNVTGHKLLIAANDSMFNDLIRSTEVDIVIINHADLKAWLDSWNSERAPLPFFIIERDEEEVRLRGMGFNELNFVKKPFNPLELLNKLSYLHKIDPVESPHELGFANTVIKLSNMKESRLVDVSNGSSCTVAVFEGKVIGSECNLESLRTLLESDEVQVSVREYSEIEPDQRFMDTHDFMKTLIEKARPVEIIAQGEEVVGEEVRLVEEIEEDLYRISKFSTIPVILKNAYLRIYKGKGKKVAFLINAGTLDEWSQIRNLVEEVLLGLTELDAVVLLTSDVSGIYNCFMLTEQKTKLHIIADYSVKRMLSESGLRSGRIRTFEDFPSYFVTIATGHRLRFIPVNFSPSIGGFCLYEEETGYLFTPEFMSSFFSEDPEDPHEGLRLYHRIFMPTGNILQRLIAEVRELPRVSKVLPRYGLPYEDFEGAVNSLAGMQCGTDYLPIPDTEKAIEMLNGAISLVMNREEKTIADKFIEDLGRFATVEGANVTDLYVDPAFATELLINSLMHVAGIKPSTIISVLRDITNQGYFLNPF